MSEYRIRKITTFIEKTLIEGEKEVETPWIIATAAAVIHNPFSGKYVEDLSPLINEYSNLLSERLVAEIQQATGWDLQTTEAVGKAAAVGLNSEIEHGCAIVHHRKFGDPARNALNGTAPLVSSEYRIGPGGLICVPIKHKSEHTLRSHHMSVAFTIPDAPANNEIVVALSIANTGRPFARIGHPRTDIM
jgi:hypothetical protein